jgi:hypothetical protein
VPKKKPSEKSIVDLADDLDDDLDGEDPEDEEPLGDSVLVQKFIRMWPRAIFHTPEIQDKRGTIASSVRELDASGVYILYRDDVPFYVGKTDGSLRSRLWRHANGVVSLQSYFWNYFSAYIVKDSNHIAEVEAILISAMPSVIMNGAKPRLTRVPTNKSIRKLMRELRK